MYPAKLQRILDLLTPDIRADVEDSLNGLSSARSIAIRLTEMGYPISDATIKQWRRGQALKPAFDHTPKNQDCEKEAVAAKDMTSPIAIEISGDRTEIEVLDRGDSKSTAVQFLAEEGLDPAEWQVTSFRKSKWQGNESVKFSFQRVGFTGAPVSDFEKQLLTEYTPSPRRLSAELTEGSTSFCISVGDEQLGKLENGDIESQLRWVFDLFDEAVESIKRQSRGTKVNKIVIARLGDHIEGFQSQGGKNIHRTPLSLIEQIRYGRRICIYQLQTLADMCNQYSCRGEMVAVPGNHGETHRVGGSGVTRYNDSFDTDILHAVAEMARVTNTYSQVDFLVPELDELGVVTDLEGCLTAFIHGHMVRPGKHWDWWQGHNFDMTSRYRKAKCVQAGHLHHFFVDTRNDRWWIQNAALEGGSQWYKHKTGDSSSPGIVLTQYVAGKVDNVKFIS